MMKKQLTAPTRSLPDSGRGIVIFLLLLATLVLSIRPAAAPASILTSVCGAVSPAQASVPVGSSGTLLFTCGGTSPAFTANLAGVSVVPTFALPNEYTVITILQHVSGSVSCTLGTSLVSGTFVFFNSAGDFDYCAGFSNVPAAGLSTFGVTWSEGPTVGGVVIPRGHVELAPPNVSLALAVVLTMITAGIYLRRFKPWKAREIKLT